MHPQRIEREPAVKPSSRNDAGGGARGGRVVRYRERNRGRRGAGNTNPRRHGSASGDGISGERATGLEPATSSLGSWHSTTELRPRFVPVNVTSRLRGVKPPIRLLLGPRRLEKAAQIGLADRGLAGRDVVQPALTHPPLQLPYQIEQVVERVHHEQ